MINFFNTHIRKVLTEKNNFKKNYYGMKFHPYNSKKESILIVKFKPLIHYNIRRDKSGNYSEYIEPINIKIIESIDNNSSSEFSKWINNFKLNEKNNKGVDMFFFDLNNENKNIISLRGCSLKTASIVSGTPFISINFFAYSYYEKGNS